MDWCWEREAFCILVRRIFLKAILSDGKPLKKRWPQDSYEVKTMYLKAETLLSGWEGLKTEFKTTKTLTDKILMIAMMYQPWGLALCDNILTRCSENNAITLPSKNILRAVAAKHLYSD